MTINELEKIKISAMEIEDDTPPNQYLEKVKRKMRNKMLEGIKTQQRNIMEKIEEDKSNQQ